jgi:flagellar basal body rod protein FlgG
MLALRYWERRQEVMANNLANVSTSGFKAERVFARLLEGGPGAQSADDFSGATALPTGNPLDLALEGAGFLVVQTEQGERYQRGGPLHLDEDGTLLTEAGLPVLGERGKIVLPPGAVRVLENGDIEVDGRRITRLRIEQPIEPPVREGANLWLPTGSERAASPETRVRQGYLEESNVDPISALVEMIEIQRAYGAVHRSIDVADGVQQTITNEIGRVGG